MSVGPGDAHAQVDAPPLAPVEHAIDVEHLARVTFGDRRLERDVLELFDRQAALLLERMRTMPSDGTAAMAHTLKGSAQGVGAWRIAGAAEQVERAAAHGKADDLTRAVRQLGAAVDEAHVLIGELLQHP
jgi:HPt (histidine-containing phosphotransfer) domain-containing protein